MASRADLEGGYVLVLRRLFDNPVFRTDAEALAFVRLITLAAWKPTMVRYKGFMIHLERGQLAISVRDLADRLEWKKDRVSRYLNTLANRDMIETANATGVNVITIRNYTTYQPVVDVGATLPLFGARQERDSTATQNKELNEGNEVREEANASSSRAKGAKRGSQLPEGFKPTLTGKTGEMVAKWPDGMLEFELEQFTDHHTSKGTISKDWDASFRTWARNADTWKGRRNVRTGSNHSERDDGPRHGMVRAAASYLAGTSD